MTSQSILDILDMCKEYNTDKIVVGYPIELDGTVGNQCDSVDSFIAMLQEKGGQDVLILRFNEQHSTMRAIEELSDEGQVKKIPMDMVDAFAAKIILEDYLDSLFGFRTE